MSEQEFAIENMVILTSKVDIDINEWITYVKRDCWKRLIRKNNTRFLILSGVHGRCDGKLGSKDHNMFLDYECAIKGLKHDFKKDIKEYNIKIFLEDIGNYIDSSDFDIEKMVEAVKKHKPTIICLAFCYTEISELNDILRAAGIYTVLIMSQDVSEITEGKYVILDDQQMEIVERVTKEKPQNLILWGSSGTGKTILLTQTLSIKVSQFKRQSIQIQIIVSTFGNVKVAPTNLMKYINSNYLSHLKSENVKFILFKDLCEGNTIFLISNLL